MTVHIFGGGTIQHVRNHLALSAFARGRTARRLAEFLAEEDVSVRLHLTAMADHTSNLETNEDVAQRLREVLEMPSTRGIIFNVALCDFVGQVGDVPSGKYAERLQTRLVPEEGLNLVIKPAPKLLALVHSMRPDVVSVGFKTTANDNMLEQVARASHIAQEHKLHWVLANDVGTRVNLVLPGASSQIEDALYCGMDRDQALQGLVQALVTDLRRG